MLIAAAAYLAALAFLLLDRSVRRRPVYLVPCLLLLAVGAAMQLMYEMNLHVPSPAGPITWFISDFLGLK